MLLNMVLEYAAGTVLPNPVRDESKSDPSGSILGGPVIVTNGGFSAADGLSNSQRFLQTCSAALTLCSLRNHSRTWRCGCARHGGRQICGFQTQSCCPASCNWSTKIKPATVLDGFAGTTRVAQALAQSGHRVLANDVSAWSKIFGTCYLLNPHPESHYQPLLDHLNALPGRDGWFTEFYGGAANGGSSKGRDQLKKPWQKHNTRRLDAMRDEMERLPVSQTEKAVLLTSLMLALDRVDSTLGHFAAYLRAWSPRSYHKLQLKVPRLKPAKDRHEVYQSDIFDLLPNVEADLAYFDPPYAARTMTRCRRRVCATPRITIFGLRFVYMTSPPCLAKPIGAPTPRTPWQAPPSKIFGKTNQDALWPWKGDRTAAARHACPAHPSSHTKFPEAAPHCKSRDEVIHAGGRLVEVVEIDYRKNVMAGMRWTHQWASEADSPNEGIPVSDRERKQVVVSVYYKRLWLPSQNGLFWECACERKPGCTRFGVAAMSARSA